MTTLTEFLIARIEEDEAAARGVNQSRFNSRVALLDTDLYGLVVRHHPARVLRECEAKRALLLMADPNDFADDGGAGMSEHADEIHRLLALPYSDHPDFRDEWR